MFRFFKNKIDKIPKNNMVYVTAIPMELYCTNHASGKKTDIKVTYILKENKLTKERRVEIDSSSHHKLVVEHGGHKEGKIWLDVVYPWLHGGELPKEYIDSVKKSIDSNYCSSEYPHILTFRLNNKQNSFEACAERDKIIKFLNAERDITFGFGDLYCNPGSDTVLCDFYFKEKEPLLELKLKFNCEDYKYVGEQ